eukprot:2547169-Rhodomonas_salina.1
MHMRDAEWLALTSADPHAAAERVLAVDVDHRREAELLLRVEVDHPLHLHRLIVCQRPESSRRQRNPQTIDANPALCGVRASTSGFVFFVCLFFACDCGSVLGLACGRWAVGLGGADRGAVQDAQALLLGAGVRRLGRAVRDGEVVDEDAVSLLVVMIVCARPRSLSRPSPSKECQSTSAEREIKSERVCARKCDTESRSAQSGGGLRGCAREREKRASERAWKRRPLTAVLGIV